MAVVGDDPVQGTRSLLELKPLITKTSVRIDDCAEIMVGYLKMIESAQPPPVEPDPSPPRNLKRAFVKIDEQIDVPLLFFWQGVLVTGIWLAMKTDLKKIQDFLEANGISLAFTETADNYIDVPEARIVVSDRQPTKDIIYTILHEIGHYFLDLHFDDETHASRIIEEVLAWDCGYDVGCSLHIDIDEEAYQSLMLRSVTTYIEKGHHQQGAPTTYYQYGKQALYQGEVFYLSGAETFFLSLL